MTQTIGSMCSGYGGLDLAVERHYGARTAWHVENAAAPSAVLDRNWPGVPNHHDIKTTDWAAVQPVDIIAAGYPCPPFSLAGKLAGINDPRHIWPDIAAALRILRPRIVVLENVANHLRVGFDLVLQDLAAMGFDARWGVVRASDAGAPHQRRRLFVVARHADRMAGPAADPGGRRSVALGDQGPVTGTVGSGGVADAADTESARRRSLITWGSESKPATAAGGSEDAADAQGNGRGEGRPEPTGEQGRPGAAERGDHAGRWAEYAPAIERWELVTGRAAPGPTTPSRTGTPQLSARFTEWVMGLPDGWVTGTPGPSRAQMLTCLGNGVVPQQAALALRLLDPRVVIPEQRHAADELVTQ